MSEKRYIVKIEDTDGVVWLNTGSFEANRRHLLACVTTAISLAQEKDTRVAEYAAQIAFGPRRYFEDVALDSDF